MAIKFDLFENPVKDGIAAPKLHAKVITKDVVTTREIQEAIHKKCTVAPADVVTENDEGTQTITLRVLEQRVRCPPGWHRVFQPELEMCA